jgi:cell division protease FtsH
MKLSRRSNRIGLYLVLIIAMLIVNVWIAHRATRITQLRVSYSPIFLSQVKAGNVARITSTGTAIQGDFKVSIVRKGPKRFSTEIPAFANTDQLSKLLLDHHVIVNAEPLTGSVSVWKSLLFGFGPTILLVGLFIWLMRRSRSGMLGAFGRSRAKRYEPGREVVTFAEVAGIDEAKLELTEVVDFLKNPKKYEKLGGRIPRGVLLSGPPGTGKTLLARAVAGEAGAPFFSMSASEFVEVVVGVGASRVRDLFQKAKEAAPAIVFIDELDAIGRARSGGPTLGGANDEREQTLNQILTEMDGFDSSTNVIVVGATNRPDVLDHALLRPGRFDRRVVVQPPDRRGRELILDVHTRSVPLADDVDLSRIAATTPGMVGADLANLVNEAALLAARRNHDEVETEDFADALEKIILGAERKVILTPDDRRRTAYHEAGHALVGMLTPGADPVRKVSIIPRGMALGVTLSAPEVDRYNYTRPELEALVKVMLGGAAAEEIVLGESTTGAENDIQQLTAVVRQMVGRWGMNPRVGMVAILPGDGASPSQWVSPQTLELLDEEVRHTVDAAWAEVVALLQEERRRLDLLADALLERETLDQDDAYEAAGLEAPPELVVG